MRKLYESFLALDPEQVAVLRIESFNLSKFGLRKGDACLATTLEELDAKLKERHHIVFAADHRLDEQERLKRNLPVEFWYPGLCGAFSKPIQGKLVHKLPSIFFANGFNQDIEISPIIFLKSSRTTVKRFEASIVKWLEQFQPWFKVLRLFPEQLTVEQVDRRIETWSYDEFFQTCEQMDCQGLRYSGARQCYAPGLRRVAQRFAQFQGRAVLRLTQEQIKDLRLDKQRIWPIISDQRESLKFGKCILLVTAATEIDSSFCISNGLPIQFWCTIVSPSLARIEIQGSFLHFVIQPDPVFLANRKFPPTGYEGVELDAHDFAQLNCVNVAMIRLESRILEDLNAEIRWTRVEEIDEAGCVQFEADRLSLTDFLSRIDEKNEEARLSEQGQWWLCRRGITTLLGPLRFIDWLSSYGVKWNVDLFFRELYRGVAIDLPARCIPLIDPDMEKHAYQFLNEECFIWIDCWLDAKRRPHVRFLGAPSREQEFATLREALEAVCAHVEHLENRLKLRGPTLLPETPRGYGRFQVGSDIYNRYDDALRAFRRLHPEW